MTTGMRPGQRQKLSVCLIARDEEQYLPGCLESVRDWADEIVLVDTGSTDGTLDIARRVGARVIPLSWTGDFSRARNAAIDNATGDWILSIDADERLDYVNGARLLRMINEADPAVDAMQLRIVSAADSITSGVELVHFYPRLHRRRPDIRYRGALHEQLYRGDVPLGVASVRTGLTIYHLGYADVEKNRTRLQRNHQIALSQAAEAPADPAARLKLADTHVMVGETEKARALYESLLQGQDLGEIRANVYWNLAVCRFRAGDVDGALEELDRAMVEFPELTGTRFMRAQLLMEAGRHAEAIPSLEALLEPSRHDPRLSDIRPQPAFILTLKALCLAVEGRVGEAEALFEEALARDPQLFAAHAHRADLMLALGRIPEALDSYLRAAALRPDHGGVRLRAGVLLLDLNRREDGIAMIREAARLDPDTAPKAREVLEALDREARGEPLVPPAAATLTPEPAPAPPEPPTVAEEPPPEPEEPPTVAEAPASEPEEPPTVAEAPASEPEEPAPEPEEPAVVAEASAPEPEEPAVLELEPAPEPAPPEPAPTAEEPPTVAPEPDEPVIWEPAPWMASEPASAKPPAPKPEPVAPPAPSAAPPPAPLLTVCLIVRDEADRLPDCLASVRGVADEIVVCDTGSTDGTPDIAASLDATVVEFPWCDDFAAARNAALDAAHGEWILVLDADECLTPESARILPGLLRSSRVDGYNVTIESPVAGDVVNRFTGNYCRLFRRIPGVRFEGRVHEQIYPSLRRLGRRVVPSEVVIEHRGYALDPEAMDRKKRRNLALLEQEIGEKPDDHFVQFNLGVAYFSLHDLERASVALRAAVRQTGEPLPPEVLAVAYTRLSQCAMGLGDPGQAARDARGALAVAPSAVLPRYVLATLACKDERYLEAAEEFRRILATGGDAPGDGVNRAGIHREMGICLYRAGRYAEASDAFVEAIRLAPADALGNLFLGNSLARAGRHEEALDAWRRALEIDPSLGDARANLETVAVEVGYRRFDEGRPADALAVVPAGTKNTDLLFLAAIARYALGDLAGARESLETLNALNDGFAEAHWNLALVCRAQGDQAGARAALERFRRLAPGDARARALEEALAQIP